LEIVQRLHDESGFVDELVISELVISELVNQ